MKGSLLFFVTLLLIWLLDPPGLAGVAFADHDFAEIFDGFFEAFFRRHQAVLVFDRKHVIIADQPQRADHFLEIAIAVPDGAEVPTARQLERIRLCIEYAVDVGVAAVDVRVFGVEEVYRFTEIFDRVGRPNALPQ